MNGYDIPSRDIDKSKINPAIFARLKADFPNESDTTLARFYLARNGDFDKVSIMILSLVINFTTS